MLTFYKALLKVLGKTAVVKADRRRHLMKLTLQWGKTDCTSTQVKSTVGQIVILLWRENKVRNVNRQGKGSRVRRSRKECGVAF